MAESILQELRTRPAARITGVRAGDRPPHYYAVRPTCGGADEGP